MRTIRFIVFGVMILPFYVCDCSAVQSGAAPTVVQSNEVKSKRQGGFEKTDITYRNALRDWKRIFANIPVGERPSSSDAYALAGKLFEDAPVSWQTNSDDVCSAGFFRIAGSNGYSLVASYDVNGRHFCNDLTVVHRDGEQLSAYSAFAEEVEDVSEVVGEIQADRKGFLVFPVPFSEYEGANSCMASWMEIYSFDSGVLVNRDSDRKDYYRKRLDTLLNEDMQEAREKDTHYSSDATICIQMEADKIKRFLGTSPDAGKGAAIRWLSSKNEYMRRKGMAVLMDIGDPQCIAVARQTALDWIKSRDSSMRGDGELWLELHGDR